MLCKETSEGDVAVDDKGIVKVIDNDGVKLLWTSLSRLLEKMQEKDNDNLNNEMCLKIIINSLYLCMDYLERNLTHEASSKELN
jgi:hypothetical protein